MPASKKPLNDSVVRTAAIPTAGKRAMIWDSYVDGFGCRISDRGVKTFIVMKRPRGETRVARISIGTYPADAPKEDRHQAIADARAKAKEILAELAAGRDPRQQEAARRQAEEMKNEAEAARKAGTFKVVAELFKKRYDNKRTAKNIKSIIDRELVARWGDDNICEITRSDVVEMIEAVNAKSPSTARQARAYGIRLFDWALNRGKYGLLTSPFYGVKASDVITKVKPRHRILSPDEIYLFWTATGGNEFPFDPYARLLLILGSRRGETANMRREQLDLDARTWQIPADAAKNEEARLLPLPSMAIDILNSLPKQSGPYVFSTTDGHRPISGFSKFQSRLDGRIAALTTDGNRIPDWMLHDLRRTMRTNLSALPIQEIVRELLIGHKKKGLSAVYDLFAYLDEKRDGMDRWAGRLQTIINPQPSNVVQLTVRTLT